MSLRGDDTRRMGVAAMRFGTRRRVVRCCAIVAVAVCIGPSVFAQTSDLTVTYLEGTAEVRAGGAWRPLATGDRVAGDARVRVGEGAMVELGQGPQRITLWRPGGYDLAAVTQRAGMSRRGGLAALIFERLRRVVRAPEGDEESSTAGVRAAEAPSASGPAWVGAESPEALIADGIEALRGRDADEAWYLFDEAYAVAGPGVEDEARFYLAYASYAREDLRDALELLEGLSPDPDTSYYDAHVLLLGQVLIETHAYAEAADELRGYLDGDPTVAQAQDARLLLGVALLAQGDDSAARDYLRAARDADPESAAGVAAAELVAEM